MRKKSIILGALMTMSAWSFAQTSHINFDNNQLFRHAKYLHLTETYLAAQDKFEKVLDQPNPTQETQEAAEFYASLEGLINNKRGAEERFLSFQDKYPKSVYVRNGAWELGSFYLRNGNYDQAYKYLTMGSLSDLPERKRNEYQFKLGYVSFMRGNNREALRHLEPLTHAAAYQDEANYYVGHIYYAKKEYDRAFEYLDELRNTNPAYAEKVLPYVVQIEFNNGQYDDAIRDGEALLQSNQNQFITSEVSKIIGESYFRQQKYNEAIPYLEQYDGKMSNADYYQLGYAYYQKGNFERAISYFNKIIGEINPMAQTAYYQLGNAYMQSEMKREALTAFKSASEMDFDVAVQEDAFYNYAKLSYEIGNPFMGTPQVLQNFKQKYPSSRYTAEIDTFLVDAYISSGNYKNALDVLNQISNKNAAQKSAEQEAAYLHATNLLTEGKSSVAEKYFDMAAKSSSDKIIQARATFWQGETYYIQGKYQQALTAFSTFKSMNQAVEEGKEIDYQLGYTNLKLRNYQAAAEAFEQYIATDPPGDFKADAKLRLADAYIGTQDAQKALNLYQEISEQNVSQSDEAAYNRAIVLGILGKTEQKIAALDNFIQKYPVSKYYDVAKIELADAYHKVGDKERALRELDDLAKQGKPEMKARAGLRKGLIYYNQGKNSEALQEFRSVAENYPKTELALQAIDGAKRIYIEESRITEFEQWANNLGYYQVDNSELETLAYDAAQLTFDEKNYAQAITAFQNFIAKYPNSAYANAAYYALGESYYLTNQTEKAREPLVEVAKTNNKYQEDALLRLSQVYLANQDMTQALLTLENLNQVTNNPAYKTFSEIHLMRIYSDRELHDKAIAMADKVRANSKNEMAIKQEAELIYARNLFADKRLNKAKEAYAALENAASNAVKAEALYYKAWFLNQDKNYEASNEVIFSLASKLSEQQYFGSKALIVMADNYFQLGDLYQANATIDAVIENYGDYPDVLKEAQQLKEKIASK